MPTFDAPLGDVPGASGVQKSYLGQHYLLAIAPPGDHNRYSGPDKVAVFYPCKGQTITIAGEGVWNAFHLDQRDPKDTIEVYIRDIHGNHARQFPIFIKVGSILRAQNGLPHWYFNIAHEPLAARFKIPDITSLPPALIVLEKNNRCQHIDCEPSRGPRTPMGTP